jgi:hypothetical protein
MNDREFEQYESYLEYTGKDENAAMDLWLRWKALTDLFYLGNDILGWKNNTDKTGRRHRVDPVFHRWLASVIEKDEDTLILVPRKHAKTTWTALYCCQLVLQNPNIRIGIFSSSGKLVRDVMRMIINIFKALRRTGLFDDMIPDPKDDDCSGWQKKTKNELTVYRPDSEATALIKEPQVTALGESAHFTGTALDIAIIDDLIDKDTVRTAEQMQKTEEWWDYIQSILELHGAITKIIGTFYHYNDLYNKIIRERQIPKRNIFIREIGGDGAPILYSSWLTQKDIDRLRKRMTPYVFSCNPGYAPVWMADMSFKNIDQIKVGDEVIGYETTAGEKGRRRGLLKSTVIEIRSRFAETVKIKMESGTEIICTPDHKWFNPKNKTGRKLIYRTAQVGRTLAKWDNHGQKNDYDKIISIEPYKTELVYSMETTTGNYVIWGYASKNCQYKLNPIPKEEQILPPPQPMHETLPPDPMGYDWYMMVDPAATATTHSDNTGIVVGAVNSIKRIYFEEAKRVKKESGDLAEAIVMEAVNVYQKHGVFPLKIGIEFGLQEAMKFAIETKRAEIELQLKIKIVLNIIPIPVSRKLSKASRVYFTLGQAARNHQISVNKKCQDLIYEMDHFTGKGKEKDDLVDAAAMIFAVLDENIYRRFIEESYHGGRYETFRTLGLPEKKEYDWGAQFVA